MAKFSLPIRKILYVIPALGIGFIAVGYYSISKEIQEKFFQPGDSIPTRVYSRPWILRKGMPFAPAEARARLAERHYKELSAPDAVNSAQLFSLQQLGPGSAQLRIGLGDFRYPAPYLNFLLHSEGADLNVGPGVVTVTVTENRITELAIEKGQGSLAVQAAAVEPVVVAQLSSSLTDAREFIPLSDIPHTLLKAIVNVEDQRFLDHLGIDPRGIARSLWANIRAGGYVQGASTITQQLIRNVYLSNAKKLTRKLKEMAMAIILEMQYSKDTILEKYLNEVYFGQTGNISVHGVGQAAKHYFAKPVDQLSIAEQALLAALIRGPFYYSPYRFFDRAKQRQELVLKKMLETNIISQAEFDTAIKAHLKLAPPSAVQDRAPYFTDLVKTQLGEELPDQAVIGAGFKVFSTVDTYYQELANTAVSQAIARLEDNIKKNMASRKKLADVDFKALQGAMVVLDPRTNQILAMVGGRSFAESNYNRVLLMKRQVGSIFKPFVYLAALIYGKDEEGQPYNAVSKLEDKPFKYAYDKQVWQPKNFEDEYLGTVTFRYALANSLNTPTARLAVQVGIPYVIETAKKAGVSSEIQPFPSISLGTTELTPVEVAKSYSTLANLGVRKDTTAITMVLDEQDEPIAQFEDNEEQVLPLPETANLVEILSSVINEGTAKSIRAQGFTAAAAGKTGTTNEYRDAWFAGFTPNLLAVSWVGYDKDDENARKIRNSFRLTGAVAALPLWLQFMKGALAPGQPTSFEYPSGTLRTLKVDRASGGLDNGDCASHDSTEEIFTYNNAPRHNCPSPQ